MNMREIQDIRVMKKWMKAYKNDYSGTLRNTNDNRLYGNHTRFFVASVEHVDVGFIRIADYSMHFVEDGLKDIWGVADGFVLKEFRGRGILGEMIKYAIDNANVHSIHIESWRLAVYRSYYTSLGFDYSYAIGNGELSRAFDKSVSGVIRRRCEAWRERQMLEQMVGRCAFS